MKIGIFDPYLNTLGGGEKYILTLASCMREAAVDVFWDDKEILKKAHDKFDLSTSNMQVKKNIFNTSSTLSRYQATKAYDLFIVMTDGSIPVLGSKRTVLIYQFAMPWIKESFISKLKLRRISSVLCYSEFVRKDLDRQLGRKVTILYPPVEMVGVGKEKMNKIITVGRFTKGNNVKKHDILIEVFKKISQKKRSWELHIAGSYLPDDEDLVHSLKALAKDFPIFFHTNISFQELQKLYKSAKIYWHATGFGEDLKHHPEKAEQFGISTVEAMSAGVVPVVVNAGGQPEIVTDGKNGYCWDTLDQLEKRTLQLIEDPRLLEELAKKAEKRAKDFSEDAFCKQVSGLV